MINLNDPEDTQHTPAERAAAASRSIWLSVAVNIALSGLQITVGVLAKSQGPIANGIHSRSDMIAAFAVPFASHHGAKEADADRQYGRQRFENAASQRRRGHRQRYRVYHRNAIRIFQLADCRKKWAT